MLCSGMGVSLFSMLLEAIKLTSQNQLPVDYLLQILFNCKELENSIVAVLQVVKIFQTRSIFKDILCIKSEFVVASHIHIIDSLLLKTWMFYSIMVWTLNGLQSMVGNLLIGLWNLYVLNTKFAHKKIKTVRL